MTPMKESSKPFSEALRDYLEENEISQRELTRRCQARGGWGSVSTINFLVKGDLDPSKKAMESIAAALSIDPKHFAEYRLVVARDRLDPKVVGLKAALRNLG